MKANHSNLKLNQEINVELTEILYRNLTLGLTGILLLITILFWQIYFDTPSKPVLIWYLILTANLLGGFIVIYWYSQTKNNHKLQPYHFYAYIIGSSITAILLGIIGSVIMPSNVELQMLTILIIIGVTGASVQNLHASYLASFCYLSFSLFPLLVWEGVQTFYQPQTYIGIFSATIMFAVYLVVDVYSGYILLLNNIKMRIEKDRKITEWKY